MSAPPAQKAARQYQMHGDSSGKEPYVRESCRAALDARTVAPTVKPAPNTGSMPPLSVDCESCEIHCRKRFFA